MTRTVRETVVVAVSLVLLVLAGDYFKVFPDRISLEQSFLGAAPWFWAVTLPVFWLMIANTLRSYYGNHRDARATVARALPGQQVPIGHAVLLALMPITVFAENHHYDPGAGWLLIPYAAWLGHRYGKDAVPVVGWTGALLLVETMGKFSQYWVVRPCYPDLYLGSLLACRLCADRDILLNAFSAVRITGRQLALFSLLPFGFAVYVPLSVELSPPLWVSFVYVFYFCCLLLGVSAVDCRRFTPAIVVLSTLGALCLAFFKQSGLTIDFVWFSLPQVGLLSTIMFFLGRHIRQSLMGIERNRASFLLAFPLMLMASGCAVSQSFWKNIQGFAVTTATVSLFGGYFQTDAVGLSVFRDHVGSVAAIYIPCFAIGVLFGRRRKYIFLLTLAFMSIGVLYSGKLIELILKVWVISVVYWYFGVRVREGVNELRQDPRFRVGGEGGEFPWLSWVTVPTWLVVSWFAAWALMIGWKIAAEVLPQG